MLTLRIYFISTGSYDVWWNLQKCFERSLTLLILTNTHFNSDFFSDQQTFFSDQQTFDAKLTTSTDAERKNISFKPKSFEFETGQLKWCLIEAVNDNWQIVLAHQSKATFWSLMANMQMVFRNKVHPEICFKSNLIKHTFTSEDRVFLITKSFDNKSVLYKEKSDDEENIEIGIQFNITGRVGLRQVCSDTFDFSNICSNSDLMLMLGDSHKRVFVNCGYLAQLSLYFSAIRRRFHDLEKTSSPAFHLSNLTLTMMHLWNYYWSHIQRRYQ